MQKKQKIATAGKVALSVVLAYALLGFVLVPLVAENQIKSFLASRSLTANIDKLGFNPFALSVSVQGFELKDASDTRALWFDEFYVNLQLSSVFAGAAKFKAVHLDGLFLSFYRYSETESNISRIAQAWAEASPASEDVAVVEQESSGIFPVYVEDFRLQQASVGFSDMVPSTPFIKYVDSIDINISELSTLDQQSADQELTISMSNGAKVTWRGGLTVTPLASSGRVDVVGPYSELAYEYLRDQLPVVVDGGWVDASFNYEFSLLEDGQPQLFLSDLQAALQTLELKDLESDLLLASLAQLSLAGGELEWPSNRFTAQSISVDTLELYPVREPDGELNFLRLIPESNSTAAPTAVAPAQSSGTPWQLALESLNVNDWQIHVIDEVPSQVFTLDLALNLGISNITNEAGVPIGVEASVDFGQRGEAQLDGALLILPEAEFSGNLSLDALELGIAQPYVAELARIGLASGALSLEGDVRYSAQGSGFDGRVAISDLLINDSVADESLFAFKALEVNEARLEIAPELSINIAQLVLDEPYARVEVETDGTTNIGRTLIAQEEVGQTQEEAATSEQGQLPAITVQQLMLRNAGADFTDRNLPLPFSVTMRELGGEVSALSSRSREPARINIEGRVDEYGQAVITGQLLPLAYADLTEIDLSFNNLHMPAMTPYVIKFAGRHIDDGRMDVDLSYRINDAQMQGQNSLILRDLVLGDRQEHPDALDLPLGLAVALLKNADGVIDLNVPVTGDLNNPQFQYGPVISQALANIIRNIVASPFKLLAGLVGGGDDEEIGVIQFVPGRSDLAPPEREKLLTLAEALLQRPQLALSLPGSYHAQLDAEALRVLRVDERLQQALETAQASPDYDMAQTPVLETLYRQVAGEQAEVALLAWRAESSLEEQGAEPQFDELAYGGSIRRALIEAEPIAAADLSELARSRAMAIEQALLGLYGELSERVMLAESVEVSEAEQEAVPMEMVLEAL